MKQQIRVQPEQADGECGDDSLVERLPWRNFSIIVALLIAVFGAGLMVGSFNDAEKRLGLDDLNRARSYFTQIVLTRKWNASFGGVYVLKVHGVESNPWLKKPDELLADGRTVTLRNPAFMTRELSELSQSEGLFTFRIMSLNPLNPGNVPDDFERAGLQEFERGQSKEKYALVEDGERKVFRYIAPLVTELSCLRCHAEQGYEVGDIRGGISVNFEVGDLRRTLAVQRAVYLAFALSSLALILLVVLFLISSLRKRLVAMNARMRTMAITDELTGAFNRRRFMERISEEAARSGRSLSSFSVGIFDLDWFKKVNDVHGHIAGDAVLKEVAARMQACLREPDLVARYGGEEFAVLLSGADAFAAQTVAERIRSAIAASPVIWNEIPIRVTISGGIAVVSTASGGNRKDAALAALQSADRALYQSKEEGRDRVTLAG